MAQEFDSVTTNPGSGGTPFAVDLFSDDGVSKGMPFSGLVYGPKDGPYVRVTATVGLPAAVVAALPAGDNNIGNVDIVSMPSVTIGSMPAVTISGTVPISAAALPLPAGAATSAAQSTGNTSLATLVNKAIDFDTGAGTDTVVSFGILLPGNGGSVIGGTAANPFRVDVTGSTTQPISNADLTAAAGSLNVMDDWDETDRCKVNLIVGQAGITGGAGAVAANTPRVTHASDDPAVVALQIMDDWDETDRCKVNLIVGQAGIAGGTGADGATVPRVTLATNVPLPAGSNAIGKLAANSGVDIGDVDVTSLPSIPAGTNNIGKVSPEPNTSGGLGKYSVLAAASDNAAVIKSSAGKVYGWYLTNHTANWKYVKLYEKGTSPNNGDTPALRIFLPPGGGSSREMTHGIDFDNGIGIRAVGGIADNDNTSLAANDATINVFYK